MTDRQLAWKFHESLEGNTVTRLNWLGVRVRSFGAVLDLTSAAMQSQVLYVSDPKAMASVVKDEAYEPASFVVS